MAGFPLLFIACTPNNSTEEISTAVRLADGVYTGVLPCADCPGIYTQLEIDSNHFEWKRAYLNRPGIFVSRGTLSGDDSGRVVLTTPDDTLYAAPDSMGIRILSQSGYVIEGELSGNYVLPKGEPEGFKISETENSEVDFRGLGHEPFWSLDISWASSYRVIFAGDSVEGTLKNPEIIGDTIVFTEISETAQTTIRIWPEASIHPASGQLFPWRVTLVHQGERFNGNGDFFKNNPHAINGEWHLTDYQLDTEYDFDMKEPAITFNTAEMRCYGNDGCNSFNGSFEISGSEIRFGALAATKMACANIPDAEFNAVMANGLSYHAERDELIAEARDGRYLVFRRR